MDCYRGAEAEGASRYRSLESTGQNDVHPARGRWILESASCMQRRVLVLNGIGTRAVRLHVSYVITSSPLTPEPDPATNGYGGTSGQEGASMEPISYRIFSFRVEFTVYSTPAMHNCTCSCHTWVHVGKHFGPTIAFPLSSLPSCA